MIFVYFMHSQHASALQQHQISEALDEKVAWSWLQSLRFDLA
jgi:hypothetical protein